MLDCVLLHCGGSANSTTVCDGRNEAASVGCCICDVFFVVIHVSFSACGFLLSPRWSQFICSKESQFIASAIMCGAKVLSGAQLIARGLHAPRLCACFSFTFVLSCFQASLCQ